MVNSSREMVFIKIEPRSTGFIKSPFEYRAVETIDPRVSPANTKDPRTPY